MELEKVEVEEELATSPNEEPAVEEETIEDLEEQANTLLFEYLKELENASQGSLDIDKLKGIVEKINLLKDKNKDNQEYQNSIDDCLERMKLKLSIFVKKAPEVISDEELQELLNNLFEEKIPVSVDLTGINVEKIVELYQELQKAIESKDLKKETAARGRLIKLLKKEQNSINHSFKDIQTLATIGKELLKEDASIDRVKEILEEDENKNLYLYFKTQLTDLETFINAFQKVIEDEEIQKLFFLANALTDQLQEQRENLDKRFSKEFLDKKTNLTSIFTDLPNAIILSIQKISNSINELKQAETQRRKMNSIKTVMKDVTSLIGAPVVFAGKYLVNNWYTMFMAYQGIKESRAEAKRIEEEKQREAEEKARIERERREAEERARQEKLRLEREKTEAAERERQARLEEERRAAEEQARQEQLRLEQERAEAERQRQEQAAREAEEERLRQEEQARQEALDREQQEQEQEQTQKETEKEPEQVQEEVIPQPTTDPYASIRGTRVYSIYALPPNKETIQFQLDHGLIDLDDRVRVRYQAPGAPWWAIWTDKIGYFTLAEIEEIWGFDYDLEQYQVTNAPTK